MLELELDEAGAGGWAVPGVAPRSPGGPPPLTPDVAALLQAVEQVQACDPVLVEGRAALHRARLLMRSIEQLAAAVLPALRDVDDRALFAHAPAGSTRGWLRTLPAGEGSWLGSAELLVRRPHLSAALADGRIALRTARAVASGLEQVPSDVEDDQLHGVLTDGVASLLQVWLGAACLRPTPEQEAEFAARRARLDAAVALGGAVPDTAPWVVLPQDRLEPVLTLLAEVLAPGEVPGAVSWLLDALLPERVAERERRDHDRRCLLLTRAVDGGWSVRGHLSEEVGQLLHDLLRAHRPRRGEEEGAPAASGVAGSVPASGGPVVSAALVDLAAAALADLVTALPDGTDPDGLPFPPTGSAGQDDDDAPFGPLGDLEAHYGGVGPGDPDLVTPLPPDPWAPDAPDQPRSGPPPSTPGQRRHDALAALLRAVAALPPGPGRPAPPRLLVTAPVDAVEGVRGALPATLSGSAGAVPLSPAALRRLCCSSRLVAVLLDAAGRPVGVSREERDASAAQRDALRAVWGDRCATHGCGGRGPVPHHVRMHSRSGTTVLEDLVPLCEGDHHAVHDGKHSLLLRDGRVLCEEGWVS